MLAVVTSKADHGYQTGGDRSEMRRVELTPDLRGVELPDMLASLEGRILAAAGVPPGLLATAGNAGAIREVYRLFCLQTVDPLSRIIVPELRRKLGIRALGLNDMMSADVAGRARAVRSPVESGVPLSTAMGLAGWADVRVPDPVPDPAPDPVPSTPANPPATPPADPVQTIARPDPAGRAS